MSETGTIERLRAYRKTYIAMLVSSALSLFASLVLSIDAIKLAAQPTGQLSCNINSVLSCGTVAKSWQSQLLGFPNSFIGLMTEPVVITVAIAGLGLVTFPRWFIRVAHVVPIILCYQRAVSMVSLSYWIDNYSFRNNYSGGPFGKYLEFCP
jgi:uncharacterized membrane protein